jgi:hypothetical protein
MAPPCPNATLRRHRDLRCGTEVRPIVDLKAGGTRMRRRRTVRLGWLAIPALCIAAACNATSAAGSPGANASGRPDASSTTDPVPSPSSVRHLALTIASGNDVTVDIADDSGLLHDATSGTPGDGASVAPYEVAVGNDDPSTLRLTWTGGPCDAAATLRIDGTGRELRLVEPECPGDAVAFDRILVLHLSSPLDASEVHAVLQDGLDTDG